MKQQILNRLGVAHVRDTMMQFVTGSITRQQAMESLQIGQSQLYSLRTSYLAARALGVGCPFAFSCERRFLLVEVGTDQSLVCAGCL